MDLLSGLLVGFLGSVHCAGMCGPLALALPVPGGGTLTYLYGRVVYNAGRVLTYAALGAVAGLVGRTLVLAGAQQIVSVVIGLVILLTVLLPLALKSLFPLFTLPARFSARVQAKLAGLMKTSSIVALFLIGLLNGLLPCGFVYVALAAAITTGDVYRGVLFMVGFGIGTGDTQEIGGAGAGVYCGTCRAAYLAGAESGYSVHQSGCVRRTSPARATLPLV
jgi:sulfite exporter TauE/SafE